MSDCSTQAMMPKEPPKTIDLHECVDCEHYCFECGTCCTGVPDHQDCMFPCWRPSRAHQLAQRYQQLERVVMDMILSFHQANGISWLDDENYKRVVSALIAQCVDDYIGELRELGVFPPPARSTGGEH